MTDNENSYISLEQAKSLVSALEQGQVASANEIIEQASHKMQQDIFVGVGKLTRQLHDSLSNMSIDERFSSFVSSSLPDAKERLSYVVEMTSQAANQTMDAVDECIPLAQKHQATVNEILPSWERLKDCKIKVDEFRMLCTTLDKYFSESVNDAEQLNTKLNDIVLAQGYQDLTGQVLHKITDLVKDVEENLIGILKLFGHYDDEQQLDRVDNCIEAEGPVVAKSKQHDVVSGQDDVDDLLSSLGF
ncbi:protein phosphatase CheZ [Psychrobium sp. 1_MG-2023]|uniref:protein phosphatase CheZ n=1 Tax=Psychrobium sp. 1_MG-2023 TaxID=3062624 RepID=UPI000C3295B0|nr:protein phosphatase CheZ [Psychrobium sp. 1_MG-2023]MDP2559819.1 protein phosphatase CheZ [Psychrobium sp. 1_MG-2023]PKF59075.1 protein phosphatase [Alteromonadales bacterium alter-6D02]